MFDMDGGANGKMDCIILITIGDVVMVDTNEGCNQ
jgi:hypothetical protein